MNLTLISLCCRFVEFLSNNDELHCSGNVPIRKKNETLEIIIETLETDTNLGAIGFYLKNDFIVSYFRTGGTYLPFASVRC